MGCKNNKVKEIDVLPGNVNYYYTFGGESNSASFDYGLADYRQDKADFVLKDIKINNNDIDYYYGRVAVYFNDKLLGYTGFLKEKLLIKK